MALLLADPRWRDRLNAATPLPRLARQAPPMLAADACAAVERLGAPTGSPVHVIRSYLAPLGLAMAERLGAAWVTLDLDDDDEALHAELGDETEARAYARLVGTFGPSFDCVAAASPADAAALERRHGFAVAVLPNTVEPAPNPLRTLAEPPDLLFVGNLTYAPNVVAARALVEVVLPAVRQRVGSPVTATIVGDWGSDETGARLAELPGARVLEFVADLAPLYARASAVVVPLRSGSGTRIKLLEAFAHRVPVVTTPAGAAGLGAVPGTHLLVGHDDGAVADAVVELISDPARAQEMAEEAAHYVDEEHSPERARTEVAAFLKRAQEAAGAISAN
jgi:glycosyltransferase involved in cell wall biosynthesis